MSLFKSLLQAVQSWRRRRTDLKDRRRAGLGLEQLDHRQLLSVNFTGNVATDFPATERPGVVVLNDNPAVIHPLIPPILKNLVKVSGLDISGIRLSYTPQDDTLSIGLEQPLSQQPTHPGPVIAGDTDNNGNSATVDPAVLALEPQFIDFPDLGGSETMGAFLSFTPDNLPTVVAGIGNEVGGSKLYQVAQALVNPMIPTAIPGFGNAFPANTGNIYLVNDPNHPNMEFSITHFSVLYQAETGKPLTADTSFNVGAFGNSDDDDGISEAFFPGQPVKLADITVPPVVCPPMSPPVLINPHSSFHVNTAHPTLVRVNVLSSSGFDATQINPATVRLGGATPIFEFTRRFRFQPFPEETLVFRGNDIQLPPGFTLADLTGQLNDGTRFDSKVPIFNRDASFYPPAAISAAQARQAARGLLPTQATPTIQSIDPSSSPMMGMDQAPVSADQVVIPLSAAQPPTPRFAPHHSLRQAHSAALQSADMLAADLAR